MAASDGGRILQVEVDGVLHEWFDVDKMQSVVQSADFPGTLRRHIEHYFGVPETQQAVFDGSGLLTSSPDFVRSLSCGRPKLYVFDIQRMSEPLRLETARQLQALGLGLNAVCQNLRRGRSPCAPAAAAASGRGADEADWRGRLSPAPAEPRPGPEAAAAAAAAPGGSPPDAPAAGAGAAPMACGDGPAAPPAAPGPGTPLGPGAAARRVATPSGSYGVLPRVTAQAPGGLADASTPSTSYADSASAGASLQKRVVRPSVVVRPGPAAAVRAVTPPPVRAVTPPPVRAATPPPVRAASPSPVRVARAVTPLARCRPLPLQAPPAAAPRGASPAAPAAPASPLLLACARRAAGPPQGSPVVRALAARPLPSPLARAVSPVWAHSPARCPGSSSRVLSPVAQLGGEHGAEPLACCADLARAAPAGSTVLLKPSRRRLEDMERVISSSPRRLAGPWSTAAAPPPAAARPPAGRPRSPAGGGAAFADDPWTPRLGL